jgi:hypothetical protein
MPATPWKSVAKAQPDREYVVVGTYLPAKRIVKLPEFLSSVRKIVKQLGRPEGLLGYSLLARPLRSDYWTHDAARRFAEAKPHLSIAPRIASFAGGPGFSLAKRTALGGELPPAWDKALARLHA